ncbi:helix-turn-helix domain-containing protein [Enterococcus sp. 5H]|uniref:helix-turn-helix domain-containing protein n=1 Tax=Enterococcus sp. 5H TaxID=1229490 RepID=UPI0023037AFF|nr:helix-turn-helix transcriptional regulator [Enterococcus sp. 5H]MDA9472680.1 Phage transcriptional regulator, Cro, CI family [Enterococcus sp. 5H]
MNAKDRVKELAAQRKMTIAELERKLNIANGTIGKWDKQNPSIEPLNKLADYFGVTTDYLLGRESSGTITESDLSKMIDNAMSFDGKPLSEHDKELAKAYLEGKFGL